MPNASSSAITFARRVFTVAGWYGVVVMLPQYFLEARVGRDYPPPITHPENYYGFIGITLAWQLLFLVIGRDPARFRPAMLPAIVEKLSFGIAVIVLYVQGRVAAALFPFVAIDFVLAVLFAVSYRRLGAVGADRPT